MCVFVSLYFFIQALALSKERTGNEEIRVFVKKNKMSRCRRLFRLMFYYSVSSDKRYERERETKTQREKGGGGGGGVLLL